jgi:hypothetical protein
MPEQVRVLRVVVASPGDVQSERDSLPEVIDELNKSTAADRGLRLELTRWQTDAYPGFHPEGSQGQIESGLDIEHSDVLIGIFWKKFGTPVKEAQSGTEHEFRKAYEGWKSKREPHIMMYFSERPYAPKSSEEMDQWSKVINFKEKFPHEGLWWPYKETIEFQKLVRTHLTQFIRGLAQRVEVNDVWPPPPQRPGLCVGRKEVLEELRGRLGILEQSDASEIQPITAMFGIGGVGKTTLAAALAYDFWQPALYNLNGQIETRAERHASRPKCSSALADSGARSLCGRHMGNRDSAAQRKAVSASGACSGHQEFPEPVITSRRR